MHLRQVSGRGHQTHEPYNRAAMQLSASTTWYFLLLSKSCALPTYYCMYVAQLKTQSGLFLP